MMALASLVTDILATKVLPQHPQPRVRNARTTRGPRRHRSTFIAA